MGLSCGAGVWDVVVIGAGPAGAVAALELARQGCAVLLVDKAGFPRSKVCGCCISAEAMAHLDELGVGQEVRQAGVPLHTLALSADSARVEIPLGGGMALSRRVLDQMLVDAARAAGAEFRDRTSGILERTGEVAEVRLSGTCEERIQARVVVVAEGLTSPQGGALGSFPLMHCRVRRTSKIGVAAVLAAGGPQPGIVAMTTGRGGYAGMVRLEDGNTNLAAALAPELVRQAGGPAAAVGEILAAAEFSIPAGLPGARFTGTPYLTRRRRVELHNVLVVGDAASYVEPFTGEGIAWALASGRGVAGPVLSILAGRYQAGAWTRLYHGLVPRRQLGCRVLSGVLRRPKLTAACVHLAAEAPLVASAIASRLQGRGRRCPA